MTGNLAGRPAKDHAPRQVRGLAPQLSVHKVGAAAQRQRQRHAYDGEVGNGPGRQLEHAAHDVAPYQAPYQAPVEAHAALVGREDLKRVGEVVPVAVKDDVEQPAANDEAKDRARYQHPDIIHGEAHVPAALHAIHNETGENGTHHVGDAVPVDGDGAR